MVESLLSRDERILYHKSRLLASSRAARLGLAVISAATGEPLYQKAFLEERDDLDLEEPPEFASSELVERVRRLLFPVPFGRKTSEERPRLWR